MTPDVENALAVYSRIIGVCMEDEGLEQNTRDRVTSRVMSMMEDAIDDTYQHIATIEVA